MKLKSKYSPKRSIRQATQLNLQSKLNINNQQRFMKLVLHDPLYGRNTSVSDQGFLKRCSFTVDDRHLLKQTRIHILQPWSANWKNWRVTNSSVVRRVQLSKANEGSNKRRCAAKRVSPPPGSWSNHVVSVRNFIKVL